MSPRPDVSEERRSQILEAAVKVFARLGFQQTRMDDIAQEAGLSKGALYLYYKSKDAIIGNLLKYFFSQEYSYLRAFIETDQQGSVREQLLLLTRHFATAMAWMTRFMPIAFEFYAIAGRDKEVRQFLKDNFRDYRVLFSRLIQRGIDRGEFRAVDAEAAAVTLAAQYEGLALLFFVDPQALEYAEQAETSLRLLLEGLELKPSSLYPAS